MLSRAGPRPSIRADPLLGTTPYTDVVRRLHEDQIEIPDALVATLIATQFPQWAHEPLRELDSDGTIHRIDRLGDHKVVRLPFIGWAVEDVALDRERLQWLSEHLPVRVPRLLGEGEPAPGMPWRWGVYDWIDGKHPTPADEDSVADGLIAVIGALRTMGTHGPRAGAMFDLAEDDALTRPQVEALARALPAAASALMTAWDAGVRAWPTLRARSTWIHGDLMPGNLLMDRSTGTLSAVIDWGASGIGHAAWDLLPAWTCLTSLTRPRFVAALDASDAEIAVAKAYAVRKAAWGLGYYQESNPGFAAVLSHVVNQVVADAR